jgi:hypothetical protein
MLGEEGEWPVAPARRAKYPDPRHFLRLCYNSATFLSQLRCLIILRYVRRSRDNTCSFRTQKLDTVSTWPGVGRGSEEETENWVFVVGWDEEMGEGWNPGNLGRARLDNKSTCQQVLTLENRGHARLLERTARGNAVLTEFSMALLWVTAWHAAWVQELCKTISEA